jgi:hypothetical protein
MDSSLLQKRVALADYVADSKANTPLGARGNGGLLMTTTMFRH